MLNFNKKGLRMFAKKYFIINLILISLPWQINTMDSRKNSSSSLDQEDQPACANFSRRVLQEEQSKQNQPTTTIETMAIPLLKPNQYAIGTSSCTPLLPAQTTDFVPDRYAVGTPYTPPSFPAQTTNFVPSSTATLRLTGDDKGFLDSATSYLIRLIKEGKLASALEPNPDNSIETRDPKITSRFPQALSETTQQLDALTKQHTQTQQTEQDQHRRALIGNTDNTESILAALTQLRNGQGVLSPFDITTLCAAYKRIRHTLHAHHELTIAEFDAQYKHLRNIEEQIRRQHPAPETIAPVSPTVHHIPELDFHDVPSNTASCRPISPRTQRHMLESQLATNITRQQAQIDALRRQEGNPSTPRTVYVAQIEGRQ